MARGIARRFDRLLNAARLSVHADAAKYDDAKLTEQRRVANKAAQAEARLADRRATRDTAVAELLKFVRDLRKQSRHIRIDGDEGEVSRVLIVSGCYRNRTRDVIEVVRRSDFKISELATDVHIGVKFGLRKVFKSVVAFRQFLSEDFLRDVARSVALAEAASRTGTSPTSAQVRSRDSSVPPSSEPISKHVARAEYRAESLRSLRSMERAMGLTLTKDKRSRHTG